MLKFDIFPPFMNVDFGNGLLVPVSRNNIVVNSSDLKIDKRSFPALPAEVVMPLQYTVDRKRYNFKLSQVLALLQGKEVNILINNQRLTITFKVLEKLPNASHYGVLCYTMQTVSYSGAMNSNSTDFKPIAKNSPAKSTPKQEQQTKKPAKAHKPTAAENEAILNGPVDNSDNSVKESQNINEEPVTEDKEKISKAKENVAKSLKEDNNAVIATPKKEK